MQCAFPIPFAPIFVLRGKGMSQGRGLCQVVAGPFVPLAWISWKVGSAQLAPEKRLGGHFHDCCCFQGCPPHRPPPTIVNVCSGWCSSLLRPRGEPGMVR